MSFALTTVTYNNRPTLHSIIKDVLVNTTFPPKTVWFFVLQNCSDSFCDEIVNICRNQVEICLIRFASNIGLSKSMAYVIEMTKKYTYVLNLEDDWKLVPTNNIPNKNWLFTCLRFLDEQKDVSTIFLRGYSSEDEMKRYGLLSLIPYRCHKFPHENFNYMEKMKHSQRIKFEDITFTEIPTYLYSFNPHICRNADYHKHAYPVPVFDKDTKADGENANWSGAESLMMERIRDLKCFWFEKGIFYHCEDMIPPVLN